MNYEYIFNKLDDGELVCEKEIKEHEEKIASKKSILEAIKKGIKIRDEILLKEKEKIQLQQKYDEKSKDWYTQRKDINEYKKMNLLKNKLEEKLSEFPEYYILKEMSFPKETNSNGRDYSWSRPYGVLESAKKIFESATESLKDEKDECLSAEMSFKVIKEKNNLYLKYKESQRKLKVINEELREMYNNFCDLNLHKIQSFKQYGW